MISHMFSLGVFDSTEQNLLPRTRINYQLCQLHPLLLKLIVSITQDVSKSDSKHLESSEGKCNVNIQANQK